MEAESQLVVRAPRRALIVAGIAALVGILWIANSKEDTPSETAKKAPAVVAPSLIAAYSHAPDSAEPPALKPVVGSQIRVRESDQPTGEMAAAYLRADDLRVFAENAKRSPERGGYFYAAMAASACGEVRANLTTPTRVSIPSDGRLAARQAHAADLLKAKCRSYTNEEVALLTPRVLRDQGEQARDPIATAWNHFSNAIQGGSNAQRRKAFVDVLRTGDPLAISSAAQVTVAMIGIQEKTVAVGAEKVTPVVAATAWELASCDFGVDCKTSSLELEKQCYFFGQCYSDISAALRGKLEVLSATEQDEVRRISQAITSGIRGGDLAALFPGGS